MILRNIISTLPISINRLDAAVTHNGFGLIILMFVSYPSLSVDLFTDTVSLSVDLFTDTVSCPLNGMDCIIIRCHYYYYYVVSLLHMYTGTYTSYVSVSPFHVPYVHVTLMYM